MKRRYKSAAVALAIVVSGVMVPGVAHADGLTTFNWASSGKVLSTTSYSNSNMVGLWQAILNSNNAGLAVDGKFGALTKAQTINWQNALQIAATGKADLTTWNVTFNAYDPQGRRRLMATGYVDGYATAQYDYYAGGDFCLGELGWNPFASQWLFSQFPLSNEHFLVQATIARTIGSQPACA